VRSGSFGEAPLHAGVVPVLGLTESHGAGSAAQARRIWARAMKKSLAWTAGIAGTLALYTFLFSVSKDAANQKAAIEVVKKSYAPTGQLLAMHPDFIEAEWSAVKYPGKLEGYSDGYEVILWLDVIPGDDRKMLKAEWLVYDGNTKYLPDNVDAQTLFLLH
jgi:hypothetical protein